MILGETNKSETVLSSSVVIYLMFLTYITERYDVNVSTTEIKLLAPQGDLLKKIITQETEQLLMKTIVHNSEKSRYNSANSQTNINNIRRKSSKIASIDMIRSTDELPNKSPTLETLKMELKTKSSEEAIRESMTKIMAYELESSQTITKNMKTDVEKPENKELMLQPHGKEAGEDGSNTRESKTNAVCVETQLKVCECCKCVICVCGPKVSKLEEKIPEEEILVMEKKDLHTAKQTTPKILEETDISSPSELSTTSTEELSDGSSCRCLPGLCRCRIPHWTFLDKESKSQISKQQRVYIWKEHECPCIHDTEKLYPSAEGSIEKMTQVSPIPSKIKKLEICSYENIYQQTIVMVKPDAMIFTDVIKRALLYVGGLNIVNERTIFLTPEQVSDIHSEEYCGNLNQPLFVLQMSRNPILVLSIGGLNAIEKVKSMVGPDKMIPDSWFFPESIKRRIGIFSDIPEALHASTDVENAAIESRYFFPHSIVEPFPRHPYRVKDYCNKYINPVLNKGLAAVVSSRPTDPVSFLAEWLLMHNPYRAFYEPRSINMVPT